jgi:hypothetical protein
MRHLLSLSPASLFPLVRHGGRCAQSGKAPRALLVPSSKTATTAKTAPVGLCGPVWPPGGGRVYGRRHAVADVAMDATVDGRDDRQHESTREHRADTASNPLNMREERDGGIRHHTELRHVDVRCQGGNVVGPDGDKRILENRGFTDFAPLCRQ